MKVAPVARARARLARRVPEDVDTEGDAHRSAELTDDRGHRSGDLRSHLELIRDVRLVAEQHRIDPRPLQCLEVTTDDVEQVRLPELALVSRPAGKCGEVQHRDHRLCGAEPLCQ